MRQSKKYRDLSITVFGRGGGVEHPNGIKFQRLDHKLIEQLAEIFGKVILVPLVHRYKSPLWKNFSTYYKEEVKSNQIKVMPVYTYSSFKGTNKLINQIKAWRHWCILLFRAIKESDLCVVFLPSTLGLLGACIRFILGKPMIAYIGGDLSIYNPKIGKLKRPHGSQKLLLYLKAQIQIFFIRKSCAVLIRDIGLYKRFSKLGKRVYYVPGNTTISKNDMFMRNDTCQKDPIICLVVSSLVPQKGVDDIIKAIKMIRQEGYPLKFWHVGGSYPENLEATVSLCRKLDIEKHVVFHGYKIELEDLLKLYRTADIFVLASHSEGFPRTITEAQSQCLPIIATRVGGIPQKLKNEYHAILINPGKPEEIAKAIKKVIHDKTMRQNLISNSFKMACQELNERSAVQIIVDAVAEKFFGKFIKTTQSCFIPCKCGKSRQTAS